MYGDPGYPHGACVVGRNHKKPWIASGLAAAAVLALLGTGVAAAAAQQSANPASLVFDGVTVVDVETGKLVPDQRVVIVGNHIKTVGNVGAVPLPKDALAVPAKGKYLIPGLWDLHVHPGGAGGVEADVQVPADVSYLLFIANGVTGFRDAWAVDPLGTLVQWRNEILAGTRVGPPRQLLSGVAINSGESGSWDPDNLTGHVTVTSGDSIDANNLVQALKKAGADWIKTYDIDPETYFLLARAARRAGMRFGGHVPRVSALDAADSGASIFDHVGPESVGILDSLCFAPDAATPDACRKVAEKFRQTNTWSTPTLSNRSIRWFREASPQLISNRLVKTVTDFWNDFHYNPTWLHGHELTPRPAIPDTLHFGYLKIAMEVGLPVLSGGDTGGPDAGFKTHDDMAILVDRGLTPLAALQAATLNPAKMLQATDSLGTVAAGKLADLVLLDADPLADITNTAEIRAVVANGRYYDRAALDGLLTQIKSKVR